MIAVEPSRGRVLVADDEPTFRESTCDLLRHAGYVCTGAADGGEALRRLEGEPVDVLVADVTMPGNEDLALVRAASARDDGLGVVLVTGYPSFSSAQQAVALPVLAYLTKPIELPDLTAEVERAVATTRSGRGLAMLRRHLLALAAAPISPGDREDTGVFVTRTLAMIADCVSVLARLAAAVEDRPRAAGVAPCQLLSCPRLERMTHAVVDAVDVLERSRRTFRSPELAALRRRLTAMLEPGPR
ncbi:MAG: response regulator [bacterium]|nr:response regulator [bacterium]